MDFDGSLKDILSASTKSYAIQMIVPGSSYLVLKIEKDQETFEKRYYPMIHESKLNPLINSKCLFSKITGIPRFYPGLNFDLFHFILSILVPVFAFFPIFGIQGYKSNKNTKFNIIISIFYRFFSEF